MTDPLKTLMAARRALGVRRPAPRAKPQAAAPQRLMILDEARSALAGATQAAEARAAEARAAATATVAEPPRRPEAPARKRFSHTQMVLDRVARRIEADGRARAAAAERRRAAWSEAAARRLRAREAASQRAAMERIAERTERAAERLEERRRKRGAA